MTKEQANNLDSARSYVKQALNYIDGIFDDKEITPEDIDSDLSEAIDRCNSAIEYLYDAKKTEGE